MPPPPVLTIAGSDCSGGAGIQADMKSISANGGYALTALTSVVSETPGLVSQIRLLDADFIVDQIRVLFGGFPIQAAKTGMVGGAEQIHAVAKAWREHAGGIPLVVDPVMVATSGGRLLKDDAVETLCAELLPLATLLTPNMDEAAVLWGRAVTTRDEMAACAADLAAKYQTAVLVKGGHLIGDAAADVLRVVLMVGRELLPALAGELADLGDPFRVEFGAVVFLQELLALHAAAFPLPRAKDLNVTGRQPLRNERRHLP